MKGQTEFQGVYKGRVESAMDPLKVGRAQVRIPCFHGVVGNGDAIPDEDLPWASYCSPTGAGCDHGSFLPPEKGDYVWVAFEGGLVKDIYPLVSANNVLCDALNATLITM